MQHTKEPVKCVVQHVGILRFISVNRSTFGLLIFVGCHRMSKNSGIGLHKFYCNNKQLCALHINICSLYVAIYYNYCEDTHQTIFHLYPRHLLGKVESLVGDKHRI